MPVSTEARAPLDDVGPAALEEIGTLVADLGERHVSRSAEGVVRSDVRATLETHDGALVFVRYNGRVDFSDMSRPGPVLTAPRFETGDPRYAWLNTTQAVMKGRSNGATLIAYRLYALVEAPPSLGGGPAR